MASSTSVSDALFDEDKISSSVSAVDSLRFFQEHGIFYQANAEIGKLVAELDSQGLAWRLDILSRYLPILFEDPVCLFQRTLHVASFVPNVS